MHTPDINLSLSFWVCTIVVYASYRLLYEQNKDSAVAPA